VIGLPATVGVADALDVVQYTHVATAVSLWYRVSGCGGGSYDLPDSFASGSVWGEGLHIGDAFFGYVVLWRSGPSCGVGWRASLFVVRSRMIRCGQVLSGSGETT
jgi:hypothetical protein